eukprot:2375576-Pleurochrysis_carterae.AAC.3
MATCKNGAFLLTRQLSRRGQFCVRHTSFRRASAVLAEAIVSQPSVPSRTARHCVVGSFMVCFCRPHHAGSCEQPTTAPIHVSRPSVLCLLVQCVDVFASKRCLAPAAWQCIQVMRRVLPLARC